MTADLQAVHRAILLAPDDDAPRLIYADWLEEHGQDFRAEFIRQDIELAKIDDQSRAEGKVLEIYRNLNRAGNLDALGLDGLGTRRQYLLGYFASGIDLYFYPLSPLIRSTISMRRGFADSFNGATALWLEFGDWLVANHPIVKANITDTPLFGIDGIRSREFFRPWKKYIPPRPPWWPLEIETAFAKEWPTVQFTFAPF